LEQVLNLVSGDQDERVTQTIAEQRDRLKGFIQKHVADRNDVEDILQDAFYELVLAYRLMKPIENAGAWLFRVVKNRIGDAFRKKGAQPGQHEPSFFDEMPSPDEGPDALYWQGMLREEIEPALDELPDEQREVFLAHEVEGRSFKELAAETGLSINTLLARKRYAVLHLRGKLQDHYGRKL